MKIFHVYILLCADDTYYVGMTSDINKRVFRHQTAYYSESYTSFRLPVKLLYTEFCPNFIAAAKREKQLKKWSQVKKEALMNRNYNLLPKLAKKNFSC